MEATTRMAKRLMRCASGWQDWATSKVHMIKVHLAAEVGPASDHAGNEDRRKLFGSLSHTCYATAVQPLQQCIKNATVAAPGLCHAHRKAQDMWLLRFVCILHQSSCM